MLNTVCRELGAGCSVHEQCAGCWVQVTECRVLVAVCKMLGAVCREQGVGCMCRVQYAGCNVQVEVCSVLSVV